MTCNDLTIEIPPMYLFCNDPCCLREDKSGNKVQSYLRCACGFGPQSTMMAVSQDSQKKGHSETFHKSILLDA